jgi:hypothetical protein
MSSIDSTCRGDLTHIASVTRSHLFLHLASRIEVERNAVVSCARCNSGRDTQFDAEVNIHSVGLDDLNRPAVLVFPKIDVCLDCGFVEFNLAEDELKELIAISHEAA